MIDGLDRVGAGNTYDAAHLYVCRAKESKAPAAERPQAQWKGGISSAGTEQAIKKSSLADQIQALRSESEGLKEDIRAGRRPPGAEARIAENLQLIRELEGKK